MKREFHFPENPSFVVSDFKTRDFKFRVKNHVEHDKFMVDLNFYENRVFLPRKHEFGSFFDIKHVFSYFVSWIDMISP